jgi:hydroxymethylglutaryl-CoA lyase
MPNSLQPIQLIECPRDAMQGWAHQIPTEQKIQYLNQLLQVGFPVLDCGSFVSPKAIPQMADTKDVLPKLNMQNTASKLLVIVANERGAQEAASFEQVSYLGFPLSISPTFAKLNTNATIEESLKRVEAIQSICMNNNKELVVYISMGFGNPYGDAYHPELVIEWCNTLKAMGVKIISLADTVGVATPDSIADLFSKIIPEQSDISIGAHLHTTPSSWKEKIDAAFQNGCTRFDGAILGIGGCPMAQEELVGNMDTLNLVSYFKESLHINTAAFENSIVTAQQIFSH